METLRNLLSPEMTQTLGWTLVHFIWQAMAIALILALALKLLHKSSAHLRYLTACIALALIVLMPVITIRMIDVPTETLGPAESTVAALPNVAADAPPITAIPPAKSTAPRIATPPQAPLKARVIETIEPAMPYIVIAWLLGVFSLSLWHLGGWTQLQKLRRRLVKPVTPGLNAKLTQLANVLGIQKTVRLMESALVHVPMAIGHLKPIILLPASALTGLSSPQLEAILAHELAHIRRHDYLVNMLQTVVEILGFYHPALWWVSHRIRVERENCCDDLAVSISGDRVRYVTALAMMEEIRAAPPYLALAALSGPLFDRIRRLLNNDSTNEGRTNPLPVVVAVLLILALLIPAALSLSCAKDKQLGPNANEHAVSDAGLDRPGTSDSFKGPGPADDDNGPESMALVPAGWFAYQNAPPGSYTFVDSFAIDKYEVTVQRYCRFLNSADPNGAYWDSGQQIIRKGDPGNYHYEVQPGRENYPVIDVSFDDAQAFATWKSKQTGLSYRLPTQQEWEKAAGWDPDLEKLWTYSFQSDTIDCSTCNFAKCVGEPTVVGSYHSQKSYYGCYDMSGNVWEWTSSMHSANQRVIRGGVWSFCGLYCQVTYSVGGAPSDRSEGGFGFRLVLDSTPATKADGAVHSKEISSATMTSVAATDNDKIDVGLQKEPQAKSSAVSFIDEDGYIVDKVDYPFVNDPQVIGGWRGVDFLRDIAQFDPDQRHWSGDLYLKELFFRDGGKTNWAFSWTKGLVLHAGDKTASKYLIKDINGSPYLFLEWKSGDYTFGHRKPLYYVLKKDDDMVYVETRTTDKIDYPFIDDPEVIGAWEGVDFVDEMKQFHPDKKQWKRPNLFLAMIFAANGELTVKYTKDTEDHSATWTRGLVLNPKRRTASKYTIRVIDGSTYMFYEWKSGDYTLRGMKPKYYVLKKKRARS